MSKASSNPSRRDLIKGAGVATVSAAFWYPSGKVLGANDRVNIAVIGIRGQGGAHIGGFPKLPGVHLKTLCDIDENNFAERARRGARRTSSTRPSTAWDMRKVFDDKDIHAVTIAHAQPLARAGQHLGRPGRQARLRGEARLPHASGKAARW